MAAVGPDGPTKYLSTGKPDVFDAYDWNPDENQYNLYRGQVRQEDLQKTATTTGPRAESRQSNVCDLWNRLTDAAEERVHVALNPTAAEFDDGDHAAAFGQLHAVQCVGRMQSAAFIPVSHRIRAKSIGSAGVAVKR